MMTAEVNKASLEAFKNSVLDYVHNEGRKQIALSMLPIVHDRIHVDGVAADGSQIGTYSKGYMVVRTGKFQNADTVSRGKNKGKNKNSGTFTKGLKIRQFGTVLDVTEKTGLVRPNFNRSEDTKVILSLTRQMENAFAVVEDGERMGLGWIDELNFQKALYCEQTYDKPVYTLTNGEEATMNRLAADIIPNGINNAVH